MKFMFCDSYSIQVLVYPFLFLLFSLVGNKLDRVVHSFFASNLSWCISYSVLGHEPLDAALPNAQLPSTFHGGVSQLLFPQNTVTPYIPVVGEGTLY
jgi:hypothetical protein